MADIIKVKTVKRRLRIARYIIYKETLIDKKEHFWTFIASFFGIGAIGFLNSYFIPSRDNVFLIGSFGASAVLVYGIINSPLAQPRNVAGGHLVSAFVGVTVKMFLPFEIWLLAAIAVSSSIVLMQITKTLHPPGGATALIAIIGSGKIQSLGYFYLLSPVFTGVVILLASALIFNNLTSHRSYPSNKNWYKIWEKRRFR